MNKKQLREYIKRLIVEELKLKKYSPLNLLAVVSDKTDRKDASIETYKNKEKLKSAGFTWKSEIDSWSISDEKFKHAQEIINGINKIDTFIDKLEDLDEFILNSDNLSKKAELSTKIEGYIKSLMDAVDESAASEEIQKFLDFGLKFHNYSFANTILIYIQKQDATKVAGFKQWQEKFFRRVKKGATAIHIFAPMFTKGDDITKMDDSQLDNTDATIQQRLKGFKLVTVFDVSDTEKIDDRGEIPVTPRWHDENEPNETADRLYSYVSELASNMGIKIGNEASKGGEMGWSSGDHINISSNISGVNRAATFIHEIAHELMHFNKKSIFYIKDLETEKKFTKNDVELQAESVSYVVLKHYGFPVKHQPTYLAMWKANSKAIKDNMDIIKKVSNFIITKIDDIAAKDVDFNNS